MTGSSTTARTGLMAGKRGLIMGVANNRSIAWGIAKAAADHGAELAFTYQGDALKKRVEPLAQEVGSKIVLPCDVTDAASVDALFGELEKTWGRLDFVVHAIAFSDKTELDGGSILTLTYYGAEKVMPHYNVMGVAKAALEASVRYLAADLGRNNIRVNAISAGPIKTLAASGIADFRYILKWNEYNSALRRTVTIEEVGDSALYLLSDLGRGVTGEVHHVDAGYHVQGMKNEDAPDISVMKNTD
jgi:enoyl-[acyl-carrier protein] reductase I